jgi:hypothetical protein
MVTRGKLNTALARSQVQTADMPTRYDLAEPTRAIRDQACCRIVAAGGNPMPSAVNNPLGSCDLFLTAGILADGSLRLFRSQGENAANGG